MSTVIDLANYVKRERALEKALCELCYERPIIRALDYDGEDVFVCAGCAAPAIEEAAWDIAAVFMDRHGETALGQDRFEAIRQFVEELGCGRVSDAMETACRQQTSAALCFDYFLVMCRNMPLELPGAVG